MSNYMESLRLYPLIGALTKQAPKGLKLSNYEADGSKGSHVLAVAAFFPIAIPGSAV